MDTEAAGRDRAGWPRGARAWAGDRATACGHGVVLGALALAEAILVALAAVAIVVPVPGVAVAVRRLAELTRRLSGEVTRSLLGPTARAEDPARGTGLSGIERRVAAFDGVLAVSSPPGGPTVINVEIPCAPSPDAGLKN